MRVLLLSSRGGMIEQHAMRPFFDDSRSLRRDLGVQVTHIEATTWDERRRVVRESRCDVAFVMTPWRETTENTIAFFREVAEDMGRPRIVYLDWFDSTSSPFFEILRYVDLYVKKQLLRDLRRYDEALLGGYVFTDFLSRKMGLNLEGWHFGSRIPEDRRDRLLLGWNLGTASRLRRRLLRPRMVWPQRRAREIDVSCRISLGPLERQEWFFIHRSHALSSLEPLQARWRVVSGGGFIGTSDQIPRRRYEREMRRSRIVFSPFGWGEICYRDFEAICFDALLVKPSMEHLVTQPDVFQAGRTYVPVRWDLSDVVDRCEHYLKHPGEMEQIRKEARAVYTSYFAERRFVRTIKEILDRLF